MKKRMLYVIILMLSINFFVLEKTSMAIERPKYTILEKDRNFELRQYEPYIVAETFVAGNFENIGNEGFKRLAGYIFGKNRQKQKISMTAPVSQEARSEKIAMTAPVSQEAVEGQWRVTFMMPSKYSLETLPEPLDSRVKLKEEPGRLMAVWKYSGSWSQQSYEKHRSRLYAAVEDRELTPISEPVWARYDPPFKPWFMRTNEVLVPVKYAKEQSMIRLEDLQWKHRIILVFGKIPGDDETLVARFQQHTEEIDERDILYFLIGENIVTNASSSLEEGYVKTLREKYAVDEQDMSVILIGKDGGEKYRRSYLDLEEIYRVIDVMPMRMREMQQQNG